MKHAMLSVLLAASTSGEEAPVFTIPLHQCSDACASMRAGKIFRLERLYKVDYRGGSSQLVDTVEESEPPLPTSSTPRIITAESHSGVPQIVTT